MSHFITKQIRFTNKIFELINDNNVGSISELIKKNPDLDIDSKHTTGETPLHYAIRLEWTELILTLSGPSSNFYMEEWDKFVLFTHVWS